MREWYNGSIVAFQAIDPGSTPGSRTFYVTSNSNMTFVTIGQLFLYEIFYSAPQASTIKINTAE